MCVFVHVFSIQVRTDGAPDGTGGGRMLAAAGLSSGKVCVWTLEPSGKRLVLYTSLFI